MDQIAWQEGAGIWCISGEYCLYVCECVSRERQQCSVNAACFFVTVHRYVDNVSLNNYLLSAVVSNGALDPLAADACCSTRPSSICDARAGPASLPQHRRVEEPIVALCLLYCRLRVEIVSLRSYQPDVLLLWTVYDCPLFLVLTHSSTPIIQLPHLVSCRVSSLCNISLPPVHLYHTARVLLAC